MSNKWTTQDVHDLKLGVEIGLTHAEIGEIMGRTELAVRSKSFEQGFKCLYGRIKTMEEYKAGLPKDIEVLEEYVNSSTKILHKHSCGFEWKIVPNSIHRGRSCPKCSSAAVKTTEKYKTELPEDIEALEEYINSYTKILHKHSCGHKWAIRPSSILSGSGCPKCAKTGFKSTTAGTTYLVYFYALGIYKVGITNRTVKERFNEELQPYDIILERHFNKGKDAKELETEWLDNLKPFLYNTNELKSGNTETFIYEDTILS